MKLPNQKPYTSDNKSSNMNIQSTLRTPYTINYARKNDYRRTHSSQHIQTNNGNYNKISTAVTQSFKSPPSTNQYYTTHNLNPDTITTGFNRYNLPSSYRVFDPSLQDDNDPFEKRQKMNLKKYQPNTWARMISRTSAEDSICNKQSRFSTSKTFQSKIFPSNEQLNNNPKRRIAKETKHSTHSTTSQIYSLPGCIKRDFVEIKDDKKTPNYNTIGRMIKMTREYNADFLQCNESEPIENSFPCKQRYGPSFKSQPKTRIAFTQEESKEEEYKSIKKNENNLRQYHHSKTQIFDDDSNQMNINNEVNPIITSYNDKKGRRHFHNKETFKSHLVIE